MPEIRLAYVRIKRDTGPDALVRPDAITHILHNTFVRKEGAEKVEVPCLSIHLGQTMVIHTEMSEGALLRAMASAAAVSSVPVVDPQE